MLNLKKSKTVRNLWPQLPDQGWLNAVYLGEKFDIGQEYNLCMSFLEKQELLPFMHNAAIIQFSSQDLKPDICHTKYPGRSMCDKWKQYRQMLPWDIS